MFKYRKGFQKLQFHYLVNWSQFSCHVSLREITGKSDNVCSVEGKKVQKLYMELRVMRG